MKFLRLVDAIIYVIYLLHSIEISNEQKENG